jgi:hypothetical protein
MTVLLKKPAAYITGGKAYFRVEYVAKDLFDVS